MGIPRKEPQFLSNYEQEDTSATTVAVYTDNTNTGTTLTAPENARFVLIQVEADCYVSVGDTETDPVTLNAGSRKVYAFTDTWIQLPIDAKLYLGGVSGATTSRIIWAW